MAYVVYIKDNVGNMIGEIDADLPKHFTVQTLQIANGLIKKGNYYLPVEHILFIHEV